MSSSLISTRRDSNSLTSSSSTMMENMPKAALAKASDKVSPKATSPMSAVCSISSNLFIFAQLRIYSFEQLRLSLISPRAIMITPLLIDVKGFSRVIYDIIGISMLQAFHSVLSSISQYSKKPPLFEPGELRFWDDPHISKGMLEAHLNPEQDAASRRPQTIDKEIRHLISSGTLKRGTGCSTLAVGRVYTPAVLPRTV